MAKIAGLIGLALANENLEVVLIPDSECSRCSGFKLDFTS